MNKVILQGRLGADPELRKTPNDLSVTSFSIAVNRQSKEKATDWIDLVAWRHTAEFICQYFEKGQQILIEGALQTRSYDDKQGVRRKATEVLVDKVYFCGDRAKDNAERGFDQADDGFEMIDDDLPF